MNSQYNLAQLANACLAPNLCYDYYRRLLTALITLDLVNVISPNTLYSQPDQAVNACFAWCPFRAIS